MRPTLLLVSFAAALGCAHGGTTSSSTVPPQTPTPTASSKEPAGQVAEARGMMQPCEPVRIHFAFDSSKLTADNRAALDRTAACLQSSQQTKVSIQGNTDERGSQEYNLKLGERRANAVQAYLTSKGVSSAQLTTLSFGKDNPLCQRNDEQCWQRNRRAAIQPACRM
jgi:peptidoglycan-associated lipoprotein